MEKKVAETLLEEKKVIVIGGVHYEMRPPSIATLVLASKYIKDLPSEKLNEDSLIGEMIKNADKLTPLGYAMSAMILGVEGFHKLKKRLFPFWKRKKQGYILAEKINKTDVKELMTAFFKVLETMNLSDFFQLTTFMIELNMTKPTKVVKTIASGQ